MEPILNPENKKFTAFPIKYQNIWKWYKIQMACFWKSEEIDFSSDYEDFMTLNDNEKHFIEMILAFFAASDGIVNFNLSERFISEIQITEILFMYSYQAMMENIHSEVYSLMLDNIVKDEEKKTLLFNAITTIPSIKDMSDWALKWIKSDKSFAHRCVAFIIVEGLFFQGPFAALFWLKKYKNKNRNTTKVKPFMCGLMDSNKFIARDEGAHTLSGCEVYALLENKLSAEEANEIFVEGVALSKNFMKESIPVELIGMNFNKMSNYIEYVADRLLLILGYKKMFGTVNPFKFMETIGLDDKTNFFEKRPTEYQDSHIMNKGSKKDIVIKDDDF
jgi:ribonucleoside-diphosphate reductase beta chain